MNPPFDDLPGRLIGMKAGVDAFHKVKNVEAYREVGNQIEAGTFTYVKHGDLHHTHKGSIGRLCNEEIRGEMRKILAGIPEIYKEG